MSWLALASALSSHLVCIKLLDSVHLEIKDESSLKEKDEIWFTAWFSLYSHVSNVLHELVGDMFLCVL